tara:strand:- start:209 stop:1177 length:969 start_codon:yes stop_codon:yes gene_type:complete
MANTIQFRRGTTVPNSGMNAGEPLFKTNDARFYIATGASTANWVGAPILDEDNMASDSALKLATQQSIKAYVDAQVATHDAFEELVDTNISNPQSGQVAVYDGTNSWDNVSISGDTTMNAAGAVTIANNAITNAKMADDAVDSAEIADGAIDTAHIANSQVTNAKLANSTTTFAGDSGSNQAMALGATFTIEGTSNEIETTMGTNKVTVGLPNNVTVSGNLTVNGTMTTANAQQVELGDVNIMMGKDNSANSVDIGFFGKYVASGTKYKGIFSDQDNSDTWTFFKGSGTEPTGTVDTSDGTYALAGIKCASVDGATVDGGTY